MLLSEKRLRALIHDILLEGVNDDALQIKSMLAGNDDALKTVESWFDTAGNLYPKWVKWVKWLADRYLRVKYKENDNLADVLPLVVNFASKDAAISQKYGSNEQFKTAVDAAFGPPEERGWTNPADATKMSSSNMNTLLALHDRKKQRIEVDRADKSWKQDKIGQFGPWALYFPTSQQNSINIAGADPVTLVGYTDWCTARTAGSNLFYSYAAIGDMLFYAIHEDKPVTDPKGRISLGYVRGELDVSGVYGGVTVDARNKGLKMPDLRRIFGSHLNGILAAAEAVVERHGTEHPAKAEIAAARQDVVKFKSMLNGLSDDEAGSLCERILGIGNETVSTEVFLAAASHKSVSVRKAVTLKLGTPPHIFEKLATDPDARVRLAVAYSYSTPPHALEKLADDAVVGVRRYVAQNKKTPPHVLERLVADTDASIRAEVVSRLDTPPHIFEKLATDSDASVRYAVARHESAPLHVIEKLAADPEKRVRTALAFNSKIPPHVFEKLVADSDASVRHATIQSNWIRKIPPHVLEKLADDADAKVREGVANSSFTPPHVLEKLATDSDASVRNAVARHESTPLHVLEKLAADSDAKVRQRVPENTTTPPHVLEKLADDADAKVRYAVARNKKTPISVHEKLVSDPVIEVGFSAAAAVARSRKAHPEILRQLSISDFSTVTRAVARNPKTPLSALRSLAQHEDKKTREAAQATLAKLQPMGEARRLAHRIIAELKRR